MINSYVINLEKDVERKEALLENIKKYNVDNYIQFNFIKAIDQSSFSQYEFKICDTWFDRYLKTGITVGEVGCALSHYKCWNEFYNSKKDHAIIFEDDIQFIDDFYEKFEILINYPKNADIVYINRKPLNKNNETPYDNNFTNIKASYWLCGYLLTRSGVEKILKTNFLDNLIVVDEFLPLLYDSHYLSDYKLYYNNIDLIGYSINNSFIKLVSGTFFESNTFHSNYYKYDNNFIVITSDLISSLSSMERFIYSCEKYSLNYLIINDVPSIIQKLDTLEEDKIIIICEPNFSFFIDNPLKLLLKNTDIVYSNFNDIDDFTTAYANNSIYFYGKNSILKSMLNGNNNKNINNLQINGFIKNLSSEDNNISNDDYIIVNGKSNVLLLNKYENYILRKVLNSYGFKIPNKINIFTFKIRVNVLIYTFNYKMCLKHLKNIDYPSELLDIHIYTNQKLNIEDNIQIHELSVFDAYKDMYKYFTEYHYIWLINSDYIITEYSLLKNCINSNKNISSGLQKSRRSVFANFWGDLSKNGWYKRSDDYFDILNLNKCNIWNVPYVNGNILINTTLLNRCDFFKYINYNTNTDVDMIFCENVRLNNEGMYLLNDKTY
jgi:GR25 family glycosyltransferase involved in LPS biosynthesis